MYFIYDYKNCLIQFSYCNANEVSEVRGVYIVKNDRYYYDDGFFYYSNEINLKKHILIPDARFYVKSKTLNKIFYFSFLLINYAIKINKNFKLCLNKISFKNKKLFVYGLFLFVVSSLLFDFYTEKVYSTKKFEVSLQDWKNIVYKMPILNQLKLNKNNYFEGKIPNIKGIVDFKIIPINSKNENELSNHYLAINYSKLILLKNDDSFYYLDPYESCETKGYFRYSIFKINHNVKILILNNEFIISNNLKNNFIVIPEENISNYLNKYNSKSICEYINLK